ncbi:MAG: 4-alpha-glucanotransferase [Granulosicoccus sp.]|nr:4-alpha-glucanotransferase [Granulosicoccus sp.]
MTDVTIAPDLLRLAKLYGINQSYWDAGGTHHLLSERTLRELLVSFGVLSSIDDSDLTIGKVVHAERQNLWRTGLPPVAVMRETEPLFVELIIPVDQIAMEWRWRVKTEDGESIDDTFTPAQLPTAGDPHDVEGWANAHRTTMDDRELARFRLALPQFNCGYHVLSLELADGATDPEREMRLSTRLIIAPARCYLPTQDGSPDFEHRIWGIAVQLYAVRSGRNWGIGDFTDLFNTIELAADLGADVVGINPLHALFLHQPERASPYGPSSRLFLNPFYIDVEQLDDFNSLSKSDQSNSILPAISTLNTLRSTEFVDYSAMARAKLPVLEDLFDIFTLNHLATNSNRAQTFRRFLTQQGSSLQKFALFEALRETQVNALDNAADDWHQWPKSLRHPDSDAVIDFAEHNAQRIQFHCWLQWLAHEQLNRAATEASVRGMKVGLYRDLAVGVASGGSDTWANQELFADNVQVGAPPDEFSAGGQNWALPALNPRALRDAGYSLLVDILRRNMSAAGALRIDHVMGLMRIFCIPAGEKPSEGAYVDYPIDDLLAIVALESQRQACIVIGEDLGTVPNGLREKLHNSGVLSYRLMYFEKHYDGDHSFRRPDEYPAQALVGANTHDLPTLRSYWSGSDLELRDSLHLFPGDDMLVQLLKQRAFDRDRLLNALINESLLSQEAAEAYRASRNIDIQLIRQIHLYLARSRSLMLIANLEDLLGQEEQINLPGTDRDVYPNWRRKLPIALEEWLQHEPLCDCTAAISHERSS